MSKQPPAMNLARYATKIGALAQRPSSPRADRALGNAHRDLLRQFAAEAARGATATPEQQHLVRTSLAFLGGQPEPGRRSLVGYDAQRYGPFLGVSDEGSSAPAVLRAALDSPKGTVLGRRPDPLKLGVALDAERLGGIGEVVVGPDEFASVWMACVNRLLMTTNVGTRANIRVFRGAPLLHFAGEGDVLAETKKRISDAFKPFLQAPGGPRPLLVLVQFPAATPLTPIQRQVILRELAQHVAQLAGVDPVHHRLGLAGQIAADSAGRDMALQLIDLARDSGLGVVGLDGLVRREADRAISLPGLLNYLSVEHTDAVLDHAAAANVELHLTNHVDAESVAREIWSGLRVARSMGLSLGKYGLFPLTLELSDRVARRVQSWFSDWPAAPVFYADQGIVSRDEVYAGTDLATGIRLWLEMMAQHRVQIVLIDTVDKALGWKLLRSATEPKGLVTKEEIAELTVFAHSRGIRVLWAGGITLPQAYEFGQLGVFGIYVTTAASIAIAVSDDYVDDPALATEKEPSYEGVLKVKTFLEAGFLQACFQSPECAASEPLQRLRAEIESAQGDDARLLKILPRAWQAWWSHLDGKSDAGR